MASPTQWTWVWVNSGSWWWTGRPGMLCSMGLQRVRHHWATELNWTDMCMYDRFILPLSCQGNLFNTKVKMKVLVAQSCPTLCDHMYCSPPGSSVYSILQARILEWLAISSSNLIPAIVYIGFPRWLSGKESACQCRRYGFNPPGRPPWRRKWQPSPVFLLGKSHGQRSLARYSPCGHKRIRHNWATEHTHTV